MSSGQGIWRVLLLSVPLMLVGATLPATAAESADKDRFSARGLQPTDTIVGDMAKAARTKDGRDDAPVAAYTGGVDGLAATNPAARGEEKPDLDARVNDNRVPHMPVTLVGDQASVTFTKACAPADVPRKGTTSCTLTATNPTFADVDFAMRDELPSQFDLVRSSVVGGTARGNTVVASGTLGAAQPPQVSIAAGLSPAGYYPLSLLGIAPITGVGDETISNFDVPAFSFGGETWTRLGVVSNGYAVIGGGTGADVNFINQNLPNPEQPNNVLAGFWTDLNPSAGGAIRVGQVTDGVDTWIVVDFEEVPEYSVLSSSHSFQIWIGTDTGSPDEDITFTYGTNTGTGDAGSATVGAENKGWW